MRYQGTDIDGPMINPEGLMVRGHNLADLMGNKTFIESVFLTMYDKFPSENQLASLNEFFNTGFKSIQRDDVLFSVISGVATHTTFSLNGLIAGLSIDRQAQIDKMHPPDLEDIAISPLALSGLYFMSILPIITGAAAFYPAYQRMDIFFERLEKAQQLEGDYIDRIGCLFRGKPFDNPCEKRLLDAVLTAFCAGFGYLTPSIMAPRISIGTGVTVGLALIAGCTTMGSWHLGTSQDVMIMFKELMRTGMPGQDQVDAYITATLNAGKKLLGFGHPFFKKDPRVLRLITIAKEEGFQHEVLSLFHTVSDSVAKIKNIYPNLETIHGAIMLSIGIDLPFLGPSIAVTGRSGGMVAHMQERISKPAFGVRNEVARNFFDKVPMDWL
jgi:citrate synthase